jgi:hypothetical protein
MEQVTHEMLVDALGNEDFWVRSPAFGVLADDEDSGMEVTQAAIRAIEKRGWKNAFEWPHRISSLEIDQDAIDWAEEQIRDRSKGGPDVTTRAHIFAWFENAGPGLLEANYDRFAALADRRTNLPPGLAHGVVLKKIRDQIELSKLSAEDSESALFDLAVECHEMEKFPHALMPRIKFLCRHLADKGAREDLLALADEWLSLDHDEEFGPDHWLGGFGVMLAGHLRYADSVPRLIEMFGYDWDWWNELIEKAVERTRSEEVAKLICREFPGLSAVAQLYLSGSLEHLCVPGFEGRLCGLLDQAFEFEVVAPNLAAALVRLGTRKGMDAARDEFLRNADDPEFQYVQELLYCFRRLLGDDASELADWHRDLEVLRHRQTSRLSEGFGPVTPEPNPFKGIGRNDPCPCGSGKKLKKCCLPKLN